MTLIDGWSEALTWLVSMWRACATLLKILEASRGNSVPRSDEFQVSCGAVPCLSRHSGKFRVPQCGQGGMCGGLVRGVVEKETRWCERTLRHRSAVVHLKTQQVRQLCSFFTTPLNLHASATFANATITASNNSQQYKSIRLRFHHACHRKVCFGPGRIACTSYGACCIRSLFLS